MKRKNKMYGNNPTSSNRQILKSGMKVKEKNIISNLDIAKDRIIETGVFLENSRQQNGFNQNLVIPKKQADILIQHNTTIEEIIDVLMAFFKKYNKIKQNEKQRGIFVPPYVRGLT